MRSAVVVTLMWVGSCFSMLSVGADTVVPASWYLSVGPELRMEVERWYKDLLPVTSTERLLPDGLYFTDQRDASRRFDLSGFMHPIEIDLPENMGGGKAELGIARRGYPDLKELWLIKPNRQRFLLVTSDARGKDRKTFSNKFMANPAAFFQPVKDGAIAFNTNWRLFRIHKDKTVGADLWELHVYPRTQPETKVQRPVMVYHGKEDKLLIATFPPRPPGQAASTTVSGVNLTVVDLKNDRSARVKEDVREPFHISLKGLYTVDASSNNLLFIPFDWAKGGFIDKDTKKLVPFHVGRDQMTETTDGEFALILPNPKQEKIKYTINSDGDISQLGGEKEEFQAVDGLSDDELLSDVEKVELVHALQLGQVDPMYGVPEVESFIGTALSSSKKTFPLLVYEPGQMPEHVVNSFMWKMMTNDIPVAPNVRMTERIYSIEGDRFLDGLDDSNAATVMAHLESVTRDHRTILVLNNFPTALTAEAENGSAAKHFTLFYKIFKDCINAGRCRVLVTMPKPVHATLLNSLKEMFSIAQTKVLPPLDKAAQDEVVKRVQAQLEQKHGKRVNDAAVKQFGTFVSDLGRRQQSPGNEVDALTRLFDYVIAERPDVAEIDQEVLREWLDRETGADKFKQGMDLDKIRLALKDDMVGHDNVIDKVVDRLRSLKNGTHFGNKPIGNFTLIGSTGVGKTYLAKLLGPALTGKPTIMIEMKNFQGFEEKSPIFQELKNSGDQVRVVCFDDINQASNDQQNHIANIVEEGMYAQGSPNQLSFRNTIIILTANWAQEIILSKPPGDIRSHIRRELTMVKTGAKEPQVPAWFWGRIESGLFVMFPFKEWQRMELAMKLTEVQSKGFKKRTGVDISVDPKVLEQLGDAEEVAQSGARSIENRLVADIFTEVNKAIEDPTVRKVIVYQNSEGKNIGWGRSTKDAAQAKLFDDTWASIEAANKVWQQTIADHYANEKEDK